jgi:hypothetical protein
MGMELVIMGSRPDAEGETMWGFFGRNETARMLQSILLDMVASSRMDKNGSETNLGNVSSSSSSSDYGGVRCHVDACMLESETYF